MPPTEYTTGVHADVSDGQLIVVLNLSFLGNIDAPGDDGKRFVIYRSERGSLTDWALVGTYWGRVRAAAMMGDELWAFFDESKYRRYVMADAPSIDGADGAVTISSLPFDWKIEAAHSDVQGLWVVGTIVAKDGRRRIAVARYDRTSDLGWQANFPEGPAIPVVRSSEGDAAASADDEEQPAGILPIIRAHVSKDRLYVYWSLPQPGNGVASKVYGACLVRSSKEGVFWRELPTLAFEHEDFCAAPGEGGRPGVILREPDPSITGNAKRSLRRAEIDSSERAWQTPHTVPAAADKLLFGFRAGSSWVRWDKGELLVRSDTQRVELLRHDRGTWEPVAPPGTPWIMLHLADVQMAILFAGSIFLVVAGSAAFAVRFVRLRRTGLARPRSRPRSPFPPAPIGARAVAAIFDLILVASPVLAVMGLPPPAANPLIPGLRPLLPHAMVVSALVIYGTVLEAWLGTTLGKLAVGLRVVDATGAPPGLVRALVRNILRPVDFFPLPTGAVGLSFMVLTDSRSRLGDLAAGTAVVPSSASPQDTAAP